jgi:hypothetical protein
MTVARKVENMKSIVRITAAVGLFLLLVSISPARMINADEQTQTKASRCCFTNPKYAGVCEVTPGEDETCSSILEYLNNPNSVGKSYCSTNMRGGWQEADCGAESDQSQD